MPTRTGRPRDPDVDRRVLDAAVDVFADLGWSGFTVAAVARQAKVGKASIYLRWEAKEDLLTEAVAAAFVPLTAIDTGHVRGDLLELATRLLDLYSGRHGTAARRMVVESAVTPAMAERWQHVRRAQVGAARDIIRRGVARGELPTDVPTSLVLDTLCGAAMLRPVAVPLHLREQAAASRSAHAADLVDFVLASARSRTPSHEEPR